MPNRYVAALYPLRESNLTTLVVEVPFHGAQGASTDIANVGPVSVTTSVE